MNEKMYMMKKQQEGFSLIELMIAMVIGLIILLGLVSLFTSSSALNRAQTGMSVLQENGRYAISRLKTDIESAGRRHCSSVAMPTSSTTNWDQGYEMSVWSVDSNVNFTNGLPNSSDINLDGTDADQLGDTAVTTPTYPLDSRYFLMGHECGAAACLPNETTTFGADFSTNFASAGTGNGDRAPMTDILTMRYLTGGNQITSIVGNNVTFEGAASSAVGDVLVADCFNSYVTTAAWGSNNVAVAQ